MLQARKEKKKDESKIITEKFEQVARSGALEHMHDINNIYWFWGYETLYSLSSSSVGHTWIYAFIDLFIDF